MKRAICGFFAAAAWHFLFPVSAEFINRQAQYLALVLPAQQAFISSCDGRNPLCIELKQYEKNFQDSWLLREKKITEWAEVNLHPATGCDKTVFYPFGGPDILFLRAFFPHCERYVLAGLEPVGGRLLASDLSHPMRVPYVKRVRQSLHSLLQRGFFVTEYLRNDLSETRAGGVLPLLLAQLARGGCKITAIQMLKINEKKEYYSVPFPQADEESAGVQIRFTEKQNPQRVKQLYYFRSDLSNKTFTTGPLRPWLNGVAPFVTFFKSASYLPHQAEFSELSGYVLTHSAEILQDDTGIPFGALDSAVWSVDGYGRYEGVLAQFQNFFQPQLQSFMINKPALPFAAGYHAAENRMLLLHMKRKSKKE